MAAQNFAAFVEVLHIAEQMIPTLAVFRELDKSVFFLRK